MTRGECIRPEWWQLWMLDANGIQLHGLLGRSGGAHAEHVPDAAVHVVRKRGAKVKISMCILLAILLHCIRARLDCV